MSGKIIFVVGHSNSGKSKTLLALTDGRQVNRYQIKGISFFIRRMSNCDNPESFFELIKTLYPKNEPYIIAALCPDFTDERCKTHDILKTLKEKDYELYFWVILKHYKTKKLVQDSEIEHLQSFGTTEVFCKVEEAEGRALNFVKFLTNIALA
jgi:ABC-type dipeptide/oligopeptide/nickel transport system ATPase component